MSIVSGQFPWVRMRRLRSNPSVQNLVRENNLQVSDLILPLFIRYGKGVKKPIASLPGHFQITIDNLANEIREIEDLKIPGVILFGIPELKDPVGSHALEAQGVIQSAVGIIKDRAPNLLVITDLCFCEYTDHGHCGIISDQTGQVDVDNDLTREQLAKQALSHAQAGSDIIAPSGMIDGMVQAIRQTLDNSGYKHLPILSYAVKYCSALYGPFREAAEGAPKFGSRRSYQMDPANGNEALREAHLDLQEGADMLMVKPAQAYLDIIYKVKQQFPYVPLGAYQVSGEFAMIKAAAEKGWIDEKTSALELLMGIKRAGADFIITYFAKEVACWLQA
jgi:porphobilinogen synthase